MISQKRFSLRSALRRSLFVLMSLVLLSGLAQPVAASAASYKVAPGATFNNPFGSTSAKWRIIDKVDGAIDHTPRGATIRAAFYSITIKKSVDKLLAAYKRGVNVQIVTDDHLYDTENDEDRMALTKQLERLKKAFGTDIKKDSFVKVCDNACMSDNDFASMHAKLYMFSTTGSSKNVAMLSSSNLSTTHVKAWNNLYTFVNNDEMYSLLKGYFESMAKQPDKGDWYSNTEVGPYRLYTFPRKVSNLDDDVYYTMLQKVSCTGVAKGYGSNPKDAAKSRTIIDLGMFKITNGRSAVAERLSELSSKGKCVVRVALSRHSTDPEIINTLLKGNVQVRDLDVWKTVKDDITGHKDHVVYNYNHNKYITINGSYDGDTSANIVFTGSPNITSPGLRYNNELLVRLSSAKDYAAYHSNFNTMWKTGKAIKPIDLN